MAESLHTPQEDEPIPARLVPEESPAADSAAGEQTPMAPQAPGCDTDEEQREKQGPTREDELLLEAAQHRLMVGAEHATPRRRRVTLPVALFLITCLSTFLAGVSGFHPDQLVWNFIGGNLKPVFSSIIGHWQDGLIYMACVLAILLAHEMGHFLMTVRYRIAASLPYFLPVPITPIGTMGAVISMDGMSANRQQMFDIGLAGPLAGLVLAVPIMWYGAATLDLKNYDADNLNPRVDREMYHLPYATRHMVAAAQPEVGPIEEIPTSRLNAFFMAGWVGFLITGLNMMPISQLDGGHVIYALFGKRAHVIARMFLFLAIAVVAWNFEKAFIWMPMIVLVTLIGTDHPPTADDNAPLGAFRTMLGLASLAIPFLCFPLFGLRPLGL